MSKATALLVQMVVELEGNSRFHPLQPDDVLNHPSRFDPEATKGRFVNELAALAKGVLDNRNEGQYSRRLLDLSGITVDDQRRQLRTSKGVIQF